MIPLGPKKGTKLFTLDMPQSEFASTIFYDSGGGLGEELVEEVGEISGHFRA